MNSQPYGSPDRHWPPRLNAWWFYALHGHRQRELRRQQMTLLEFEGLHHLAQAGRKGLGVLITPNHSFHWDSYCLLEAAQRLRLPFYTMTAWQVFAQSSWFESMSLQRCGCFSVDREGADLRSLRTAIDILVERAQPLVIFPEGDIFHTNDWVTPLRDGAASIALLAAKKAKRPVVIIPTAIKRWYLTDPAPSLRQTMSKLEKRLFGKPNTGSNLLQRLLLLAQGLVGLKELQYLGETRSGTLASRMEFLARQLTCQLEVKYGLKVSQISLPDRVVSMRRQILKQKTNTSSVCPSTDAALDDLFLVSQLYSYKGDYLCQHPSWERMAETLDKLEEDFLGATYPTVRGPKRVIVRFGEPIRLPSVRTDCMPTALQLITQIQTQIQQELNQLNSLCPSGGFYPASSLDN